MLAIWAKHTNNQCASTETCATCSIVRFFFFRRPTRPKICW